MGMTQPIPNMNPTGVIGAGSGNTMPGQQSTPFSAFTPTGTGGPGNMNFGNSANPRSTTPSAPQATPGTPAATPAPYTPTAANQTMTPAGQTVKQLQDVYGTGMGQLIWQYLQSNGGYNSTLTGEAVSAQNNAAQQTITSGANDLESRLGAEGVSGGSTEFTQPLTDYESQATTQLNAIDAQEFYNMWNASENREVGVLEQSAQDTATAEANKPNWMDYADFALGLVGVL